MRINFVGNICNSHYVIAKALREVGIDAHLYFPKSGDVQVQPASEDPEVAKLRPAWLHPYTIANADNFPHLGLSRPFLEELASCDLLHVHDIGLVWAHQTGRPYIWHPHGSDVYQYPFYRYWYGITKSAPSIPWPVNAGLFRIAIRDADAIILQWWLDCWAEGIRLINHLGWKGKLRHIPLMIDVMHFSPGPRIGASGKRAWEDAQMIEGGLKIFHPSRQFPVIGDGFIYFGNDLLYRALGRMKRAGIPFSLYVIEKGNAGEIASKQIIKEVGIEDKVFWIPMMPRYRLIEWYRSADITVAELAGGSIGAVGIEALACGCPVMANFLVESNEDTFWPPLIVPPLINVKSEEDIFQALKNYTAHPCELAKLSRDSRKWVEDHLSATVVTRHLISLYEEILGRQKRLVTRGNKTNRMDKLCQRKPGKEIDLSYDEFIRLMDSPNSRYGEIISKPEIIMQVIQSIALELGRLNADIKRPDFWLRILRLKVRHILIRLMYRLLGPIRFLKLRALVQRVK